MYENISDFLLLVYIFEGVQCEIWYVFRNIPHIFMGDDIYFCVLGVRWGKYVFSGN